jgi:hypothetical protein
MRPAQQQKLKKEAVLAKKGEKGQGITLFGAGSGLVSCGNCTTQDLPQISHLSVLKISL